MPFAPHALLPQLPLDAPPVGQPVDETQPSPDLRPLVVLAQHHVTVATIAHRDPEEIVDQVEIDRDIGSHMSHHVAHELGDDNARVIDHFITAFPMPQRSFDEVTCVRCTLGNRGESGARVHSQEPQRVTPA